MWSLNWLEQFEWDLRFAIRTLFRNRGFMVVAVASLAIGIGADTTIFSVINTVLFRPLPFKNPGRLVTLYEIDGQGRRQSPTHELFVQWNAQSAAFEAMAYFTSETRPMTLSTGREAVRTTYQRMHLNLFPLLGVEPALGRGFLKEDLNGGQKSSTVILSHRLWQSQFGAGRTSSVRPTDSTGRASL